MAASSLLALSIVAGGSAQGASEFILAPHAGPTEGGTSVTITPPDSFTAISAGGVHSFALDTDGNAWAWGGDDYGKLGDGGTNSSQPAPVSVTMPAGTTFTAVSGRHDHSLALDTHGNAWAWGSDGQGKLGDGAPNINQSTPVAVTMPANTAFIAIDAGGVHSVALDTHGNAWAWGYDGNGQLGDAGPNTDQNLPVAVTMPADTSFTAISAGNFHSVALDTHGNAWAWGSDTYGQLGDAGPNSDQNIPVAVTMPADTTFTAISTGSYHTVALDTHGNAWAWGHDNYGQLGDGAPNTDRNIPVAVTMPADTTFTAISTGTYHTVALDTHGNAWAWGYDGVGQLGDAGTNTDQNIPVAVTMPAGVTFTTISAGNYHSLALDTHGNGWAWGYDFHGQLGDGDPNTDQPTPVPVLFDRQLTSVTFGGIPGTDLVFDPVAGTWSVTTPPHAAGAVDVVIQWEANGITLPARTLTDGFTYEAALAATGPNADTALAGAAGALLLTLLGLGGITLARGRVVQPRQP